MEERGDYPLSTRMNTGFFNISSEIYLASENKETALNEVFVLSIVK
jgi:hypothetical protein